MANAAGLASIRWGNKDERRACPLCGYDHLVRLHETAPITWDILPKGYCYARCGSCQEVIEVETRAFTDKQARLVEDIPADW